MMPAKTVEATMTTPTPADKNRIIAKLKSAIGVPWDLQPKSMEVCMLFDPESPQQYVLASGVHVLAALATENGKTRKIRKKSATIKDFFGIFLYFSAIIINCYYIYSIVLNQYVLVIM